MKKQHTTMHSRRRWLFMAFPALAAVLFALVLTLPALADTVYNITYPVTFYVTNPCNGENIVISGNEHDTLNITSDGNGGLHIVFRGNLQDVTGVGDQGNKYHAPSTFHFAYNIKVGAVQSFTTYYSFISQGSAPNFRFREDAHFTINADGTVTSSFDNIRTECRG